MFGRFFIILLFLFSAQCVYSQRSTTPAPENQMRTYVTDKTGTLTTSEISTLNTKLAEFDKKTSTQIVVWMESSLNDAVLEERSLELAEQNGVGQKGKDNGALLYIAKSDRKLRIEVGYGLEGPLTDALCNQIIRNEITPQFKKSRFYDGINAGVDAMIKATQGEYKADDDYIDEEDGLICGVPVGILIAIFLVFVFLMFPLICGIFRGKKGKKNNDNWWWTGGSGWSSGSGSSWGSGSSGSSFGGFSGGGGSFGGGGSSGSW
jgi:uncharacterized protein